MTQFAYLFERFPSFGQTFCYREVAELARQGVAQPIFSIRKPKDEPPQDWDKGIVKRVQYLPEEEQLLREVSHAAKKGKLTREIVSALDEWGRRTDFLRLYQAVYVGLRLQEMGIRHVHAHFAGMAARTAFWMDRFFGVTFSFTAHANDIFAPRDFEIGLDKLLNAARVIVTETDYAEKFLQERFPNCADRIHRIYNALNRGEFRREDYLAGGTVFVLPSVIDSEGGMDNLPTVIMEAMATGLPVISTAIGGIPEMVIDNETGLLVSAGDARALADAIENVITNPSLARRLGEKGHKRASKLFSIEQNVRDLCGLLL